MDYFLEMKKHSNFPNIRNICTRLCEEKKCVQKPTFTILFFFPAQEMVEKDFTLLIGLSVALTVFLVVSLTSIRILRRKGRSPSMYTMTNLSKRLKLFLSSIFCGFQKRSSNAAFFFQCPNLLKQVLLS